ncbi:ER membrane protein complex subunit 2-A-like isoform X2 [Hetaerina americana]|uniref:ER membrane protein complex subunit 2-A-like isoform X2 n=1 Tax=Hetaerina americana TaxID=62018 RepID=UPI003A7F4C47
MFIEARDLFRSWRELNDRKSCEVVNLWENILRKKIHKLGDEKLMVYEQVCLAALDTNRMDVADQCLLALKKEFSGSLRVRKLQAMKLEAMERYDEALEILDNIIRRDETNAAPRKRRVAILKARGRISEAIKELTEYLKKFMSDQEAWQELSELYLMETDFARAAFCMEELLLQNPHNHLVHQRYAEIRYTQGGYENMEIARAHYCQAIKLNPNNIRALYGLFLIRGAKPGGGPRGNAEWSAVGPCCRGERATVLDITLQPMSLGGIPSYHGHFGSPKIINDPTSNMAEYMYSVQVERSALDCQNISPCNCFV